MSLLHHLLPPLALFSAGAALALARARAIFAGRERILRRLRRMPVTSIAAAGDNTFVKIVGELVYDKEQLQAPISGEPCAFFEVVIERLEYANGSSTLHEKMREKRGVDFFVRDDGGQALVRVHEATALIAHDHTAQSSALLHNDPALRFYLEAHALELGESGHRATWRAREGRFATGDRIVVAGLARWEPDPRAAATDYREAPLRRLTLQAEGRVPLYLSDEPKAQ